MNITMPATSGNQPPSGIFRTLAARNTSSTDRKHANSKPAEPAPFPDLGHNDASEDGSNHHIARYRDAIAAARLFDDLKPRTRIITATISPQFTAGR
jgi:hypothetical protein